MSADLSPLEPADYQRGLRGTLFVGFAGLLLCVPAILWGREQFFRSYLWAFFFVLGITLGNLILLQLQYLTGGGWGFALRRISEAATRTTPVLAVLFLPILLGINDLYEWAEPSSDPKLHFKQQWYLNPQAFTIRAAIYFAFWIGWSYLLSVLGKRRDRAGNTESGTALRQISAAGLVLYGITITFAAVDWVMSLEPHWFSSIFGVLIGVGQLLSGMAFSVVVALLLRKRPPLSNFLNVTYRHDFGKLLLAFTMIWAYISISQFLLIWMGNLPEEIVWYLERFEGGWQWLALSLVIFQFVVPFSVLLSRDVKRNPETLIKIAAFIVCVRLIDLYWIISPAPHVSPSNWSAGGRIFVGLTDIAALCGVGGLWLAAFLWQLQKRPLVPTYDPEYTTEALAHV